MATTESTTPAIDLTPRSSALLVRGVVSIRPDASVRELVGLADHLAMQAYQITARWPDDMPMPAIIRDNIRNLHAIMTELEDRTRPEVKHARSMR